MGSREQSSCRSRCAPNRRPTAVAMQGIKLLCNARHWTIAGHMGRLPHACVLGCMAPDCLRHVLRCPVLERALASSLGPRLPDYHLLMDGVLPQWRNVVAVAEVFNNPGDGVTVAQTAALSITYTTATAFLPARRASW